MTDPIIEANEISRYFGNFCAVDKISLTLEKEKIFGFLGPNGSGKSTTIRMLTGLLMASQGTIKVLGMSLPENSEKLKPYIGYMTQKFSLYSDLSVLENLKFVSKIYGLGARQEQHRIAELLSTYGLDSLTHHKASGLSGGQKQRLALAAAVLNKPNLLFLDEPTSAVDPENRRDFWEQLYDLCAQGTSILVSTHYMDEAERCHQLAILEAGKLRVQGAPKDLMSGLGVKVIEIDGDGLRKLKQDLLSLKGISSVAQLGGRLRVLVDQSIETPTQYINKFLAGQANGRLIEQVRPNLEDVFVRYTGDGRQ